MIEGLGKFHVFLKEYDIEELKNCFAENFPAKKKKQ